MQEYVEKHGIRTSKGMDLTVLECRPEQFGEATWSQYISLCHRMSLEFDPDSPPTPGEQLRKRMLDPSKDYDLVRFLAFSSGTGELLGKCVIDYPNSSSPIFEEGIHTADIEIEVDQRHRRMGVGTALLRVAAEKLVPLGRGDVQTIFSLHSGRDFFKAMGARVISERSVNRLYMKDVDWGLMKRWTEDSKALEEGVRLEFHDSCIPDTDLEEFCRVYTICGRSVPDYHDGFVAAEQISPHTRRSSEERWKSLGIRCLTLFSREPSGTISGLTECYYYSKDTPYAAGQDLTGVLVPYRNRGTGKWLKAEMMMILRRIFPAVQFVETDNSNDNEPMMAINNAMGYRRFRDQWLAKIDLGDLPTGPAGNRSAGKQEH
ncbi:MAG: GNAT family N-acetyltransferase [Candidatus Fermentibacteraceae bacterium]|nr:GNAT family N-acetyltransferase [Candidatus Fermentibacteraceae bacterium]MBN2609387.1 GNAT family N-acetyltransferase [Candidatus Fermentibacteraceae bacterium]